MKRIISIVCVGVVLFFNGLQAAGLFRFRNVNMESPVLEHPELGYLRITLPEKGGSVRGVTLKFGARSPFANPDDFAPNGIVTFYTPYKPGVSSSFYPLETTMPFAELRKKIKKFAPSDVTVEIDLKGFTATGKYWEVTDVVEVPKVVEHGAAGGAHPLPGPVAPGQVETPEVPERKEKVQSRDEAAEERKRKELRARLEAEAKKAEAAAAVKDIALNVKKEAYAARTNANAARVQASQAAQELDAATGRTQVNKAVALAVEAKEKASAASYQASIAFKEAEAAEKLASDLLKARHVVGVAVADATEAMIIAKDARNEAAAAISLADRTRQAASLKIQ